MEDDIILEGYLKKWTGLLTGWRDRYFTLKEKGTLEFADKHHGKDKGVIHLKIAKITLTPKDPLRITIDSGLKEISLRASSIIDKYRWVSALREAAYGTSGESGEMSHSQNKTNSSQRVATNQTGRPSSMANREPYVEGTFRKIYDFQNQILGILSNLHGKSLAKDVKEQLGKMEALFKEMMQNIVDWKEIIAAENERIERMKEKLDSYFDNLDGVRVNVDDGTVKEFAAIDDSEPRSGSGQHKRGKPVLTQQNSFGESSIPGSETQTNIRGLSFSEVTAEKKEEAPATKLFPIPDEGSPIEKSAEKQKTSGNLSISPKKQLFADSPTKVEVMELPDHSEQEITKKSRFLEADSRDESHAHHQTTETKPSIFVTAAEKDRNREEEEEEEEKERVEELAKSSRMLTKRGADISEDEEQFYSVLNPQISKIINNRTINNDKTMEGGTMFHTVIADDTQDLDKDEEVKLQEDPELGVLKYLNGQDETNQEAEPNPFVQKLLKENSAFKGLKIPYVATRESLPADLPQNIGDKAWNYTGINTLEVPLSYHEPLSFLQKLCEQFEYSELLDQADELSDPLLRMAYAIAFVISGYHTTSRRLTKPLDALLGETFEFCSEDNNNFKFVAEQTSVEPPVTVYYGSSDHFEVNGSICMKTEFLGKCVEVKLEGKNEIRLKKSGDVYVFTRPITSLDHILTGKYCINNYGEMRFKNLKTQENATVSLLKRSWDEKSVNRLEGYIKDNKGQFVYKVSGKWDEEISIEHLQTKETRLIWRKKMLDTAEKNFGFTKLALQLNHLHNDIVDQLPQTDSRFRPDVRAMENGDYELASTEKRRLKEKEQKLVKVLKNNNTPYKPKWFDPVKVEEGAERFFLFNGKYFKQKLNDPDTFDLYN